MERPLVVGEEGWACCCCFLAHLITLETHTGDHNQLVLQDQEPVPYWSSPTSTVIVAAAEPSSVVPPIVQRHHQDQYQDQFGPSLLLV